MVQPIGIPPVDATQPPVRDRLYSLDLVGDFGAQCRQWSLLPGRCLATIGGGIHVQLDQIVFRR